MNRFNIVVLLAVAVLLYIQYSQIRHLKSQTKSQLSIIEEQQSELITWKDKYGREHAKKLAVESSLGALKEHSEEEMKNLEESFQIRIKNMRSSLQASLKYSSKEKVVLKDSVITLRDTVYTAKNFHIKDSVWADIRGVVYPDSIDMSYKFYDSLTFITHYEKQGLFKPKKLKISAISQNPHASYSNLKSVTITEASPKRFSVGPHIGYDITGKPTLGISVQYSLFRF